MKISTRGRYGIRAVFDLAYYGQGKPEQVRKVAERQEVPPRYLEQIFFKLKKAGIVKTQRGAKGGYYLGKPASGISLADVIRVTHGPLQLVDCSGCPRAGTCAIKPFWDQATDQLNRYFDSISIADLCKKGEPEAEAPGPPETPP